FGDVEAAEPRQMQVADHDVRLLLADQLQSGFTVVGLAHDFDVDRLLQDHPVAGANQSVILDQHHPNHAPSSPEPEHDVMPRRVAWQSSGTRPMAACYS